LRRVGEPAPRAAGTSTLPTLLRTAGEYDDNKNFERLQASLDGLFSPLGPQASLPIADRVTIAVTDGAGQPRSNARIAVRPGATPLVSLPTGTDGRVRLFPMLDGFAGRGDLTVDVTSPAGTHAYPAPAGNAWTFAVTGATRAEPTALDLAFVVDATPPAVSATRSPGRP
jgi:hypothetical protein